MNKLRSDDGTSEAVDVPPKKVHTLLFHLSHYGSLNIKNLVCF
jgi:hypothetical protein